MTDLATRPETTDATTDPLRLLTSRPRQLVRAVLLVHRANGDAWLVTGATRPARP